MNSDIVGKVGEDITQKSLVSSGFNVFTRNFRSKYGEIDIVAFKDDVVYFIEVKSTLEPSRSSDSKSSIIKLKDLAERVDNRKVLKIRKTAEVFFDKYREFSFSEMRLGLSVVMVDKKSRKAKLRIQFMPI